MTGRQRHGIVDLIHRACEQAARTIARGVPRLAQLAILANVGNPGNVLEMGEVAAAARTRDLEVARLEIRRAEDIAPAIEALKGGVGALYVCTDLVLNANRIRIYTLALSRGCRR